MVETAPPSRRRDVRVDNLSHVPAELILPEVNTPRLAAIVVAALQQALAPGWQLSLWHNRGPSLR